MQPFDWFAVACFMALDLFLAARLRAEGGVAHWRYELVSCPVNIVVMAAVLYTGVTFWAAVPVLVYMLTQAVGTAVAANKLQEARHDG